MKYKNYIYLIILLLIAAINFNVFLKPYNLVCGGTQGLSIIINKITGINNYIIILVINLIMILISYILLNKKITQGLIISTFMYPLFIKITDNININCDINLIIIIITGIISGWTSGLIYKLGFSNGGINLLSPLINKYTDIKIGTLNIIINGIIIFVNVLVFGFKNFIFSILIIIIHGITVNLILYLKKS